MSSNKARRASLSAHDWALNEVWSRTSEASAKWSCCVNHSVSPVQELNFVLLLLHSGSRLSTTCTTQPSERPIRSRRAPLRIKLVASAKTSIICKILLWHLIHFLFWDLSSRCYPWRRSPKSSADFQIDDKRSKQTTYVIRGGLKLDQLDGRAALESDCSWGTEHGLEPGAASMCACWFAGDNFSHRTWGCRLFLCLKCIVVPLEARNHASFLSWIYIYI